MSDYPLIIIGGGLSGLAAGIRFARFGQKVLILEKHSKPGGLNSYYTRQGRLFETGLHAITNYAGPEEKHAPLNRLFRQLKLSRQQFPIHQQLCSEVVFPGRASLSFSNSFDRLLEEIRDKFPRAIDRFLQLVMEIKELDAFRPQPRMPTRARLLAALDDELLVELLLCPLMFYGASEEHDMDFTQFAIMFRAIFLEGMFRPAGTIKDFLELLISQYKTFGGELRLRAPVLEIMQVSEQNGRRVHGVRLASVEVVTCDVLLSTIGHPETLALIPAPPNGATENTAALAGRVSFIESIALLPRAACGHIRNDRTIIFYNLAEKFFYGRPEEAVDLASGVICFPDNFQGLPTTDTIQIRVTHLANYDLWKKTADKQEAYRQLKEEWIKRSRQTVGKIIGNYPENVVYEDSFTPLTIERFTARSQGAVYGSPRKIKDGRTPYENLFIAGTDQGFLGIVGSMLSGVSIVNQCILQGQDSTRN